MKTGDHTEAEEAFADFSAIGRATPWTPEGETKALLDALRSHPYPKVGTQRGEVWAKPPEAPLLGRDRERRRLRKTLKPLRKTEVSPIGIGAPYNTPLV